MDGVRAIAVLMVMGGHFALPGCHGGFLGVDVFFVLSGFLITSLLVEEWEATGAIGLLRFYMRRALRLLPAVVVLLIVTAPFVQRVWTLAALFYVINWSVAFGYLRSSPINHLWSLAIEEQYYLVWPLVLIGLLRSRTPRGVIVAAVGLLALGSAALKILSWSGTSSWIRLYHGSDTRADALLIGCGLGLLLVWGMLPRARWFRMLVLAASIPAFVGFAILVVTASIDAEFLYRGAGLSLVALAAGVLLLQIMISPVRPIVAILEWRPLVAVGRISYGLYLWHHVIAWIPNPWVLGTIAPTPFFMLRVALSFGAAWTSHIVIERPMLGLKNRFRRQSHAVTRRRS